LFALRRKRPDIPRPVRAPAYPWLPALYVALTALIAINLLVQEATQTYSFLGLALVVLGVPVYYGWRGMVAR
jgi:basic amino acid/polyamine antiporter, APA family